MSAAGTVRRAPVTRDDWETPQPLFDLLNREFQFTIDGAANADNRKCPRWLGPGSAIAEDAFTWRPMQIQPEIVWCNPPYGSGLGAWMALFATWAMAGADVVALVPNATDARWFRDGVSTATEVRLLSGRVQFVGTTSSNPSGSALFIWRYHWLADACRIRMWDWR